MPSHRHQRPAPQRGARPAQQPQRQPGGVPAGPSVSSTVQAMDAQLRLIAQRIKVIENNEQVIGQTLVSQKKKMAELEKRIAEGGGGGAKVDTGAIKAELRAEFQAEIDRIQSSQQLQVSDYNKGASQEQMAELEDLKKRIEELSQSVAEMKYIVGSLNPMEYVTIEDVNQIVSQKLRERGGTL